MAAQLPAHLFKENNICTLFSESQLFKLRLSTLHKDSRYGAYGERVRNADEHQDICHFRSTLIFPSCYPFIISQNSEHVPVTRLRQLAWLLSEH